MRGILEQIEENNGHYQPLTLDNLKEIVGELFNNHEPVEYPVTLPIEYALSLSDENFRDFMTIKKTPINLIGGIVSYTKLKERMKLLGINND